jgi:hypothetical protein
MSISGVRLDEPLYISSSGSNDEARIDHNGTDFLIDNDTGKTKFGNLSTTQVTIDHTNTRVGIGTTSPTYTLHAKTAANTLLVTEYTGGAVGGIGSTSTATWVGGFSAHPLQLYTSSVPRLVISTSGTVTIPAAYSTVISGTNTDLYIDSTGLLGPLPSSERYKTNIRDNADTSWIYDVPIKTCDYYDGTNNITTVIAEELEAIAPQAVRYGLFHVDKNGETKPVIDYDIKDINIQKNKKTKVKLHKKTMDNELEDVDVILLPISVNRTDFIYPLTQELQKLRQQVITQEARISSLEDIAGIAKPKEDKKSLLQKLMGKK